MTEKKATSISTADYNARFQYIRKCKDFLLGDCFLLKDKTLKRTVLAKERVITSQNELQKQIKNCALLTGLNQSPNIIQFYGFTFKETPHNGPNTWSLIELREFVDHDAEREMASRLRDKDVFSEEDMWTIVKQLVNAFARLQALNVSHGHVCPKAVSLVKGENLQAKILWSDFHPVTYNQIVSRQIPFNTKCYLAPELVNTLQKKNKQLNNNNNMLSDVFSLGVTILSLCTLGDVEDIYNVEDLRVNVNQIKSKLSWIRSIYSERLYTLLTKMLKIDTDRRNDFRSLEDVMSYMSVTEEAPEDIGSPTFAKFRGSTSPTKFGNSTGRRTITGFEVQKLRQSASKKISSPVMSPLSGRNTAGSGGFTTTRETSSPIKIGARSSPKPLNQRIEATVFNIFDKKGSLLKREGFVSSDILLGELEKRLLQDPLTKLLKSGMQVKYYPDGAKYEGNMKGKLREGVGIFYFTNGNIYAGEWKNDKFNGRGVFFFGNGERYEGQLTNGMKNGQGVFYYQNKRKYSGNWKDDKKHGKGIFYYGAKETYEGDWENGLRHGEGTFCYASGDKYTGGWENDERSGNGTLVYSKGGSYEGEWADGKPHGIGLMLYPNDERYEGYWADGMKSGKGIYYYENGSRYEGEWENDDKQGQGTLFHHKGERYSGEWREGLKHGHGTYYYENGGVYQGDWENDLKHGAGVMLAPDGTNYEGEWVAGERCGTGMLKLANGDMYEGDFIKDMMSGTGVYQWINGDVYEGNWARNKMHGKGTFFKRNGESFKGIWEAQKLVKVVVVDDDCKCYNLYK